MTKRILIFNPSARGEKSRKLRHLLDLQAGSGVTLAETRAPGDGQRLAAQAVADGCDLVIAAGGDGTINEVINGLGTSGITLAVMPVGTVNVFARELGIPLKPRLAWEVIERGATRTIDLAAAESAGQRRLFVQLAGVGLDATAVLLASWELKKRIGPMSYVWAGLQTLARPQVIVEVWTDRPQPRGRGAAVLIGNGRFYGGPFPVFPQARLDDGLLDVCIFHQHRYWDMIRYGQGIVRGVHTSFADVTYFQATTFECRSPAAPFQLDGESAGTGPVRFSVVPRALRVIAP